MSGEQMPEGGEEPEISEDEFNRLEAEVRSHPGVDEEKLDQEIDRAAKSNYYGGSGTGDLEYRQDPEQTPLYERFFKIARKNQILTYAGILGVGGVIGGAIAYYKKQKSSETDPDADNPDQDFEDGS